MEKASQSVVSEANVPEAKGNSILTHLGTKLLDVRGNIGVFFDELPFRQPSRLERVFWGSTALALATEPLAARTAIVMAQEQPPAFHQQTAADLGLNLADVSGASAGADGSPFPDDLTSAALPTSEVEPVQDEQVVITAPAPSEVDPTRPEFKFGPDISPADRAFITDRINWAKGTWPNAPKVSVYASSSVDSLLETFKQDCTMFYPASYCNRPDGIWDFFRQELQGNYFLVNGPGVMLAHISKDSAWAKHSPDVRTRHLTHDYFHGIENGLSKKDRLDPLWMAEGNADYSMVKTLVANKHIILAEERARFIREARARILPLSALEDYPIQPLHYTLGYFATEYLVSKYGEDSLLKYWRNFGVGETWQSAFENTFGLSVSQFYNEFNSYIAQVIR